MKIAVIGSTGFTGRQVLEQGIQRGYAMTAFTRRPQELAEMQGLQAIVPGDGRNQDDVLKAVRGQDAVISIVGSDKASSYTAATAVTKTLILTMHEAGVRRLICVSAHPVVGQRPWPAILIVKWIFRRSYADLANMERLLLASDIDWTVFRPMILTNSASTGQIRRERVKRDFTAGPYSMSRDDLAAALLDSVDCSDDIRVGIEITSARR